MSTNNKKVAVIGGGISGLFAITMLKEEGIPAICFERTDKPGGTWCYREKSTIGVPSLMPTTILNNSKELGAISNFPPDKKNAVFMKHKEMYNYLNTYWSQNDVLKYVKYNTEVTVVKKAPNYYDTGKWSVTTKCHLTGSITSDIYDIVIVSTGYLSYPKLPTYKGQEKFKGQIIHTHSLKNTSTFENKNVVVVGMACSGLDAAVEISNVANQVYLSTRNGAHVVKRVGPRGYPFDLLIVRRLYTALLDMLPSNFCSWLIENAVLNMQFNSKLYTVEPKHHIFSRQPIINDHIDSKLLSKSIIQKHKILEFNENGVLFEGDAETTEVDAVIMGTGYEWKFPFLGDNILEKENGQILLYKGIWPPYLKHATLAFIGFLKPWGPGIPLSEMQSRFVAHIFADHGVLPTVKEMLNDIERRRVLNSKRYVPCFNEPIETDYVQYLDEISNIIGAKPNFFKLLFKDPKLFFALKFGPSVPYQYRLEGPHKWKGAIEAILSCEERINYPLKQTENYKKESSLIVFLKKALIYVLPNA